MHVYASMQVCKYASMQICKYASITPDPLPIKVALTNRVPSSPIFGPDFWTFSGQPSKPFYLLIDYFELK